MLPITHSLSLNADSNTSIDVVGDVHGYASMLIELLRTAGWHVGDHDPYGHSPIPVSHPHGRRLILLGDLVNKGPESLRVLRLYEVMLLDALSYPPLSADPKIAPLARQIRDLSPPTRRSIIRDIMQMPHRIDLSVPVSHPLGSSGRIQLLHGMSAAVDRDGVQARRRAIFGPTLMEKALHRACGSHWADSYQGEDVVIHGHTPAPAPQFRGKVIGLDTHVANSEGSLSMLRLDDMSIISKFHDCETVRGLSSND